MAYSNTNKDKGQPGGAVILKKVAIWVVLLIIIFFSASNIYQQATILKEARQRNAEKEQKITTMEKENEFLDKNIAQATDSAYIDRKYREYLGLGTSDDVWLLMPKDEGNNKSTTEITVVDTKPVITQWWDLFTK